MKLTPVVFSVLFLAGCSAESPFEVVPDDTQAAGGLPVVSAPDDTPEPDKIEQTGHEPVDELIFEDVPLEMSDPFLPVAEPEVTPNSEIFLEPEVVDVQAPVVTPEPSSIPEPVQVANVEPEIVVEPFQIQQAEADPVYVEPVIEAEVTFDPVVVPVVEPIVMAVPDPVDTSEAIEPAQEPIIGQPFDDDEGTLVPMLPNIAHYQYVNTEWRGVYRPQPWLIATMHITWSYIPNHRYRLVVDDVLLPDDIFPNDFSHVVELPGLAASLDLSSLPDIQVQACVKEDCIISDVLPWLFQ